MRVNVWWKAWRLANKNNLPHDSLLSQTSRVQRSKVKLQRIMVWKKPLICCLRSTESASCEKMCSGGKKSAEKHYTHKKVVKIFSHHRNVISRPTQKSRNFPGFRTWVLHNTSSQLLYSNLRRFRVSCRKRRKFSVFHSLSCFSPLNFQSPEIFFWPSHP